MSNGDAYRCMKCWSDDCYHFWPKNLGREPDSEQCTCSSCQFLKELNTTQSGEDKND